LSTFEYDPHPRSDRSALNGPPKIKDAADELRQSGVIGRFNQKVGLKVTFAVGTMWAAYLFMGLAFISAPSAFRTGDPIIIVAWIAQTFLQLVLLPIIIVGQNIQAKAADMRAESTYRDAEAILHEALQIQQHLEEQDKHLTNILAKFERN
jgi:hypothetical protein